VAIDWNQFLKMKE
jgi:hypothetical protein